MKIFLITDIHFGTNTNYPLLQGEDYINVFGEEFERLLRHIRSEMEQCDLVVNLGDLIHDENVGQDAETYKKAMLLLANKTLVKHVLGNHDVRNITREDWCRLVGEKNSYYSFDIDGYHHIILDGNRVEPRGPLYIDEKQLLWLENDLAATSLATIVYCHFPMDNQNMDSNYYFKDAPERASLGNKRFVRQALQKSKKVIAVFSGHTHFFAEQVIKNIHYLTVPSFSENNGEHQPKAEYAIATLSGKEITVEIKKVNS